MDNQVISTGVPVFTPSAATSLTKQRLADKERQRQHDRKVIEDKQNDEADNKRRLSCPFSLIYNYR